MTYAVLGAFISKIELHELQLHILSIKVYLCVLLCFVFNSAIAAQPTYYSFILNHENELSRIELIEKYFHLGLHTWIYC